MSAGLRRACRRLGLVWFAVAVAIGTIAAPAGAADVLAAADGRHVFVARRSVEADGWEVVHIDALLGPESHRTVYRTTRRPEAITAAGDRCVLVLAPVDAERPVRLGVSFRVVQHPLNDVWYADPPGDPRVLPPLPSEGGRADIGGLVAAGDERVLVFAPSQRSARGVSRDPEAGAGSDAESGSIHRLDHPLDFDWTTVPSPPGFEQAVRLATGTTLTDAGVSPLLVWIDAADVWRAARLDGEAWQVSVIEGVGRGDPESIASFGDRTLLAVRDSAALRLLDLLPDGEDDVRVREFATLSPPVAARNAVAVGTVGGPWVIGLDGGAVQITTVDRVDGRAVGPVVTTEVEVDGSLVEFPIYATLLFSVMLAALLLRPHVERQPGSPAEGLVAAGLLRRAAGLCIDLAPGMMAAVLVFDLDPASFLAEVQAGDPKAVAPVLLGTAVASLVAGVLEVAMGRSLGKLVVGLRVVALDGTPGTRLQRGLRAALRFVVLMFWPIGVLAIVEPLGRGMPELLSRTVVVPATPPVAPESSGPGQSRSDADPD